VSSFPSLTVHTGRLSTDSTSNPIPNLSSILQSSPHKYPVIFFPSCLFSLRLRFRRPRFFFKFFLAVKSITPFFFPVFHHSQPKFFALLTIIIKHVKIWTTHQKVRIPATMSAWWSVSPTFSPNDLAHILHHFIRQAPLLAYPSTTELSERPLSSCPCSYNATSISYNCP